MSLNCSCQWWYMRMEILWNDIDRGNRRTRRQTYPTVTLSTTKPMNWLGSESGAPLRCQLWHGCVAESEREITWENRRRWKDNIKIVSPSLSFFLSFFPVAARFLQNLGLPFLAFQNPVSRQFVGSFERVSTRCKSSTCTRQHSTRRRRKHHVFSRIQTHDYNIQAFKTPSYTAWPL
jgi:hypothetical protein